MGMVTCVNAIFIVAGNPEEACILQQNIVRQELERHIGVAAMGILFALNYNIIINIRAVKQLLYFKLYL